MILPGLPSQFPSRRFLRRSFRVRLRRSTIFSIGSVCFLSLAGLTIISFLRQGSLLIKLNSYLLHLFGWGVIFLPFILTVAGLVLTKLKTPVNEPHVFVGAILLLLSSLGLTKAGVFGREIWIGTAGMITSAGALLVLVGGVLIGLIVLFNTSIDQVIIFIINLLKSIKGFVVAVRKPKVPKVLEEKPLLRVSEAQPLKAVPAKEELAPGLSAISSAQTKIWEYPPITLLSDVFGSKADRGDIKSNAAIIEKTLESFGISARVVEVNLGPAVTQYAFEVALGTKLSKITALSNDLALALAAPHGQIRIEAPIPGRSLVGIELPNRSLEFVTLKKMLESNVLKNAKSKLTVALGLDVSGEAVVADIARMPHVLIAGSTGSGKTVLLNSFIATLLFQTTPNEVKLILVDPKRVELVQYNGVPHLLTPVIVDPEKVLSALKWAISEMDRRYKLFAETGVRNIDSYNELSGFVAMPYIVIIIDELADIILFAPVEVEDAICRIAQMARATGIHLVISTQRPSVDVLTGLIKANIPCRISFAVSSMVDSRVILDQGGAEKLLGRGDMLYIPPDQAKATRIQGAFVSEPEIQRLIDFLRKKAAPAYTEEVTTMPVGVRRWGVKGEEEERDELFEEALRTVCQYERASASLLQRRLSIGYARAARILDQLEAAGVVGPGEGSKPRDVLVRNPDEFLSSSGETS
ncbi:MAG: DNA translocase FtsK [Patescibacteria group bacterium]